MLRAARLPGLAALLYLITVSAAHAQTVYVTNAPQGAIVEFILENTTEGTVTVNEAGSASIVADPTHLGTRQFDASIFVDTCGTTRRVMVLDRTTQPPPAAGSCRRTEISGVYFVQKITSLVFNIGNTPPTMLVRQGEPPAAWLKPTPTGGIAHIPYRGHFALSGGAGLASFRDYSTVACGNITDCPSDLSPLTLTAGAAYWFLPYLAAEGTYVRFDKLTASATGTTFNFNSDLDAGTITIAGVGAYPAGKVTIYGKGGTNYHGATSTVRETIFDATATVGDVTQPVAGGSQVLQTRTGGWGWLFGGGVDVWVTRPVAIYGEVGRLLVNGSSTRGGEGNISDPVTYVVVGAKVRLPSIW